MIATDGNSVGQCDNTKSSNDVHLYFDLVDTGRKEFGKQFLKNEWP